MNKKFSTLVASLLLSSAFSVYAGNAKPMLATPTQVETRATSADVEEAMEIESLPDMHNLQLQTNGDILSGFTNNSRLYVVESASSVTQESFLMYSNNTINAKKYDSTKADEFYWTLDGNRLVNNHDRELSIMGITEWEIIPLQEKGTTTVSPFFVLGRRDNDGNLYFVEYFPGIRDQQDKQGIFKAGQKDIEKAAIFCSVETAYSNPLTGENVNAVLKDGFNLSISSLWDENASIANAEIFAGKLTAMVDKSTKATTTTSYYLMNESGKVVVFDRNENITSDANAEKGKFKLVDFASAGVPTTAVTDKIFNQFSICSADNGSGAVKVLTGAQLFRLYNARVNETYALTVANIQNNAIIMAEDWAATSFGLGNIIPLKSLLTGEFYTVDFMGALQNPEAYKKDGRLAILDDNADFVAKTGLYEKAPEAQWAISAIKDETTGVIEGVKLINREAPNVYVEIKELRQVAGKDYYRISKLGDVEGGLKEGDYIQMKAVVDHRKTDGYAVFNANDLRNKTWYLGQARQTADGDINVYWTENHAGSHQIGATVEEEKASKWNLSLVTKNTAKADYRNQIDSVLVVSELQTWNPVKSRIDAVQDTLVILPYAFQNRSNAEFVKYNDGTNLNYYECRPYGLNETKEFAKGTWDASASKIVNADARFALKMKADGTYNYVVLAPRVADNYDVTNAADDKANVKAVKGNTSYASEKVFQENSTINGTWSQMDMYAKDANSLMFVTEVTAPEYRKLVTTANLDTIKLYRADNEAQVVYEKKDTKASTLLERPVSFLNIDNVEQFKDINPALYADTAYVNRGNNTRYQYLLGVNIEHKEGWYCDEHGFTATPPCKHAVPVSYNQGRYLINMIDTANILAADLKVSIHNNPFINETEEGNQCAKLAFVDAIHVLTDSVDMTKADKLYVINNEEDRTKYSVIDLSTPGFNVAKFAFKYTDSMVDDNFKIQTQWKDYNPNGYNKPGYKMHDEGYLRWVNGCLVVDETYQKGDVFNMNEDETRTPTANEEITAEGSVVVAGVNGAVVVKGAEGKSVIVSTILGKVVANEVVSSDNATIAAPQGVVVVSVDGESFKVVVK